MNFVGAVVGLGVVAMGGGGDGGGGVGGRVTASGGRVGQRVGAGVGDAVTRDVGNGVVAKTTGRGVDVAGVGAGVICQTGRGVGLEVVICWMVLIGVPRFSVRSGISATQPTLLVAPGVGF